MQQPVRIAKTQRGTVLIVALLLLALMVMVSFSSYNGTVLEARMTGNAISRSQGFQTAEFVLRAVERSIDNNIDDSSTPCTPGAPAGTAGLVTYSSSTPPGTQNASWWSSNSADATQLAGWTTPASIDSARYAIENIGKINTPTPTTVYRITARVSGYGGSTVVVLESTYACN